MAKAARIIALINIIVSIIAIVLVVILIVSGVMLSDGGSTTIEGY